MQLIFKVINEQAVQPPAWTLTDSGDGVIHLNICWMKHHISEISSGKLSGANAISEPAVPTPSINACEIIQGQKVDIGCLDSGDADLSPPEPLKYSKEEVAIDEATRQLTIIAMARVKEEEFWTFSHQM